MVQLSGWRYVAFISTIVGVTGAAIYPIIIQPLIDPSYYSKNINHIKFTDLFNTILHLQKTCKRKLEPAWSRKKFNREVSFVKLKF